MISLLLNWFVPFHSLMDPINPIFELIESAPRKIPAIKATKEVAESVFSLSDSFGLGSNVTFDHKKNVTEITYSVSDITPLFSEGSTEKLYQFQFPDYMIGLVPYQFVIDFVRASDVGYITIANESRSVPFSDPYLGANCQPLTWHDPSDVSLHNCRDSSVVYPAPVILTKLRELMDGDLDRFTLLTRILTQTPFNDMYKTIAAHIHKRYSAIVLNGRGGRSENILDSLRLRSYEISITKVGEETVYKVVAMIAGFFSACSVPPGLELIERRDDKEIGWYCSKIVYDLDKRTAEARHMFIFNQENVISS